MQYQYSGDRKCASFSANMLRYWRFFVDISIITSTIGVNIVAVV